MDLCVLTSSYPRHQGDPAGAFVKEHLKAISETGWRTQILAPDDREVGRGNKRTALEEAGVRVHRIPYFYPRRAQRLFYGNGAPENLHRDRLARFQAPLFMTTFTASALIASRNTDILLSHWAVPAGLTGALCSFCHGLPHLMILHSAGVAALHRLPGGRAIARFTAAHTDQLCAVADFVLNRFLALLPREQARSLSRNAEIIPMGIPPLPSSDFKSEEEQNRLRRELGIQDRFAILFLGRLDPVKGLRHLLRAVRGLEGVVTIIAGEGPDREALMQTASPDIRFLGALDYRLRFKLLRACDVLALPSVTLPNGRTEGQPQVIMEAMAAGLPVVASSVGGIGAILTNGREGFLVPPADEEALCVCLKKLMKNPRLCRQLGRQALEKSHLFQWTHLGPKHQNLIYRAIEERKRRQQGFSPGSRRKYR